MHLQAFLLKLTMVRVLVVPFRQFQKVSALPPFVLGTLVVVATLTSLVVPFGQFLNFRYVSNFACKFLPRFPAGAW